MTWILKHIVFVAVIAVALLFSAGASPTVMAAAMAAPTIVVSGLLPLQSE